MNPTPPTPSPCSVHQAALQALLDGTTDSLLPASEAHWATCAACQRDREIALALRRLPRSVVPATLADRIVQAVLTDTVPSRRRVREALVMVVAIAACLVLAVAIGSRTWQSANRSPHAPLPTNVDVALVPKTEQLSVDSALAEASDAVASLSRRTTTESLDPARKLFPNISLGAPPMGDAIEPAAQSLADIRQGASSGFAPMARSARRAFDLFVRDIPIAPDRKPDF